MADVILVSYNPAFFMLGMQHGESVSVYTTTPEGAKAFAENLTKRVAEYESTIRKIDSSGLQLGTVSPIQPRK
ncbi:MAG: hypothetical protein QOE22_698 [Candidatus Parcubacteria bacterium]|nr:hypothetical protein [Candidatus Parcubacteria bacterium]